MQLLSSNSIPVVFAKVQSNKQNHYERFNVLKGESQEADLHNRWSRLNRLCEAVPPAPVPEPEPAGRPSGREDRCKVGEAKKNRNLWGWVEKTSTHCNLSLPPSAFDNWSPWREGWCPLSQSSAHVWPKSQRSWRHRCHRSWRQAPIQNSAWQPAEGCSSTSSPVPTWASTAWLLLHFYLSHPLPKVSGGPGDLELFRERNAGKCSFFTNLPHLFLRENLAQDGRD